MTRAYAVAAWLVCACHWDVRSYPPDAAELALREVTPGESQVAGRGLDWRRGVQARGEGEYDDAVRAFVAELRGPSPIPVAGAHLLAALPHSKPHTRRMAKRRGRRFDPAGLEGLSLERSAMAMCGGRPVAFGRVSCGRDPPVCTYRFHCEGGGRREIAVGSRELWFGTQ